MQASWEAALDPMGWSATDVVKLHVATTLALCAALDGAGSAVSQRVAANLRSQILENDDGAWSLVSAAIARVLEDGAAATASNDNGRIA